MAKMLSFEMHKLFRTKSFYIWTAVSIALSLIYLLITYGTMQPRLSLSKLEDMMYHGETGIISVIGMFAKSPMVLCLLIFVCGFVCTDFENNILKNVVSKGFKRTTIFTAKYITCIFAAFVMIVLNTVCIFGVSTMLFGSAGRFYILFVPQLILLIVGIFAFAGIGFMFCAVFKKIAPAIVLSILALLGLPIGLNVLDDVIFKKPEWLDFSAFWLGGAESNLADVNITVNDLLAAAVFIVVYLVITYVVSMAAVRKMEV